MSSSADAAPASGRPFTDLKRVDQQRINKLPLDQMTAPMKSQCTSSKVLGPVQRQGELSTLPSVPWKPSFASGSKDSLILNEVSQEEKERILDEAYRASR